MSIPTRYPRPHVCGLYLTPVHPGAEWWWAVQDYGLSAGRRPCHSPAAPVTDATLARRRYGPSTEARPLLSELFGGTSSGDERCRADHQCGSEKPQRTASATKTTAQPTKARTIDEGCDMV